MSFMEEIVKENIPIWDACAETLFVKELQTGALPREKMKQYMIQDSIYLKHYARFYGKAIYHFANLKDIQMYYSVLNFVTEEESHIRLAYLKQFGLTDADIEAGTPLPENQKYIDFIQDYAEEQYFEDCKSWCAFADEKCRDLPAEEKEKLSAVFQKASLHEFAFWEMAYGE